MAFNTITSTELSENEKSRPRIVAMNATNAIGRTKTLKGFLPANKLPRYSAPKDLAGEENTENINLKSSRQKSRKSLVKPLIFAIHTFFIISILSYPIDLLRSQDISSFHFVSSGVSNIRGILSKRLSVIILSKVEFVK